AAPWRAHRRAPWHGRAHPSRGRGPPGPGRGSAADWPGPSSAIRAAPAGLAGPSPIAAGHSAGRRAPVVWPRAAACPAPIPGWSGQAARPCHPAASGGARRTPGSAAGCRRTTSPWGPRGSSGRPPSLLHVALDRRPHGVEVRAHGAQLVDALLFQLAELFRAVGFPFDRLAELALQPGNLGLRHLVGIFRIQKVLLARLVLVDQALQVLEQFLVELQDLRVGAAGFGGGLTGSDRLAWLFAHYAVFSRPCCR